MNRYSIILSGAAVVLLMLVCVPQAQADQAAHLPYDIAERGLTGRTYYVSPDGDDTASGGESDPLRTLQAAADRVLPGDTVLVRGGVYRNTEALAVLSIMRGGTSENWVRFANYPGETPKIVFDSLRAVRLEGVSHVVFEGFEIDGQSYKVDPEAATRHAEAFKGEDHSQTRFFGVGIRVESAGDVFPHHIIIRNNKVHDCSGGGIATARADYVLIENNEVYRTSFYTPWGGSAISVWESANHDHNQDVYRTVIKDNICYQNDNKVKFWMIGKYSDGNGIILDALKSNQGIIGDGYSEAYDGRILVVNNVCFLNGGRGVNIYESGNVDVIHNTLYLNGQRDNIENEIEVGRADNCTIYNNIICAKDGRRAVGGYESEGIVVNYNLIHNAEPSDFDYGSVVLTGAPRFVSPPDAEDPGAQIALEAVDFTLLPDSPAIGAGSRERSFPVDRAGRPRPVSEAPDLGAYEH